MERLLTGQEKMKAILKAGYEEMKAHRVKVMAIMMAGLEDMKSIVEHQDFPKKETTVQTIGALED
jgi:hypothetical protein